MVWVEKSKTGFQDGGYGGHFGFPMHMILAIFHLHVNLLLLCKFQLNLPCDLQADVQSRFSIRQLWRPSWISNRHDFSSFRSRSSVATEHVLAQTDQRFWKRMLKIDFQDGHCGSHLGFSMGSSILAICVY